ncbi:MAG: phosphoketolase, partial [Cyanobacteria bacterium J06659_2]
KLVYRRKNQERIHVRGYKEQGNINTPLELAIRNQVDRFNLVIDVIDRVPKLGSAAAHVKERMKNQIIKCLAYAFEEGTDIEEITNWKWPYSGSDGCS